MRRWNYLPGEPCRENLAVSKLVLDSELRKQFKSLHEQFEVCDEAGQTLGHFLPEELYQDMVNVYLEKVFPKHEIEEALQQSGGRTLKEIWQRLGRAQ
jgi:hypothetical protein